MIWAEKLNTRKRDLVLLIAENRRAKERKRIRKKVFRKCVIIRVSKKWWVLLLLLLPYKTIARTLQTFVCCVYKTIFFFEGKANRKDSTARRLFLFHCHRRCRRYPYNNRYVQFIRIDSIKRFGSDFSPLFPLFVDDSNGSLRFSKVSKVRAKVHTFGD